MYNPNAVQYTGPMNTEMITEERRKLIRWESRGGKHWVELYSIADMGFGFAADGAGGWMGKVSLEQALYRCERECSWRPSQMKRVFG